MGRRPHLLPKVMTLSWLSAKTHLKKMCNTPSPIRESSLFPEASVCNDPSSSSNQNSTVSHARPFTCSAMLQSKPPILMYVKISAKMSSCWVVPPCTKVLVIVSRRSFSPNSHKAPKFVSLPPLTVSTPFGRVPPLSPPSAPSSQAGFLQKTTQNTVPKSFTVSVHD